MRNHLLAVSLIGYGPPNLEVPQAAPSTTINIAALRLSE